MIRWIIDYLIIIYYHLLFIITYRSSVSFVFGFDPNLRRYWTPRQHGLGADDGGLPGPAWLQQQLPGARQEPGAAWRCAAVGSWVVLKNLGKTVDFLSFFFEMFFWIFRGTHIGKQNVGCLWF